MVKSLRIYFVVCLLVMTLLFLVCVDSSAADEIRGAITSSASLLKERIHLLPGDKAIVNLGTRAGIIKGDLLQVADDFDIHLLNPIGQCAVIAISAESDICELLTTKTEVKIGDLVFADRVKYKNEKLRPLLERLLVRMTNPYEPYRRIRIYVHNMFDEKNQVTKFGERLRENIAAVLLQKRRIILKDNLEFKKLRFYPNGQMQYSSVIDDLMRATDIDVFLTGFYHITNNKASITLQRIDRYFGSENLVTDIPLDAGDMAQAEDVILPYEPVVPIERLSCRASLKELQYKVQKDEKKDIIQLEAQGDLFREFDLSRKDFNIIAPINASLYLDEQKIDFGDKPEATIYFNKGQHKIQASYSRGYFLNSRDALVYESPKVISKEAFIVIEKDGYLSISTDLNPAPIGDTIAFKVSKIVEKERIVLKPIFHVQSDRKTEVFKD